MLNITELDIGVIVTASGGLEETRRKKNIYTIFTQVKLTFLDLNFVKK